MCLNDYTFTTKFEICFGCLYVKSSLKKNHTKAQIFCACRNDFSEKFNFSFWTSFVAMEKLCKRFPHLAGRIFDQVNDESLNKCKEVSGEVLEYLEKERFFWIRIIKVA